MKSIRHVRILCLLLLFSCEKYLEKVPDSRYTIPTTLSEFQKLLDNPNLYSSRSPSLGNFGCDDYFLSYDKWKSLPATQRNSYLWEKEIYDRAESEHWSNPYEVVYYSNVVLEGIEKIEVSASNKDDFNRVKGTALFYRSFAFFNLEETFGKPYNHSSSDTDLGIVLRLTSNVSAKVTRSTVKIVYSQIIQDLVECKDLLPATTDFIIANRPSKAVAMALLARVYLSMQDYEKSRMYADSSLRIYSILTDYNSLDVSSPNPFSPKISEVMFMYSDIDYAIQPWPIDTTLLKLYDKNDLRRTAFFHLTDGVMTFKGSYYYLNRFSLFSGFATDEMYLVKAECNARLGNVNAAMEDLNTLLVNRYKAGTFIPIAASDTDDALTKILVERRKELILRGIRWIDLRRLNQDPRFAITLTRILNGQKYTLPPNDYRYTYPIPSKEILLNEVTQNER